MSKMDLNYDGDFGGPALVKTELISSHWSPQINCFSFRSILFQYYILSNFGKVPYTEVYFARKKKITQFLYYMNYTTNFLILKHVWQSQEFWYPGFDNNACRVYVCVHTSILPNISDTYNLILCAKFRNPSTYHFFSFISWLLDTDWAD